MSVVAPGPRAEPLLGALDLEQRAAAELPDGPAQVTAPAGSGKTTTLIARLGVLLERGVAPGQIAVVTFNGEAAAELSARIATRLAPLVPGAEAIEVRTLHALARQVRIDAGEPVRMLADRLPLPRAARRRASAGRGPEAPVIPEAACLTRNCPPRRSRGDRHPPNRPPPWQPSRRCWRREASSTSTISSLGRWRASSATTVCGLPGNRVSRICASMSSRTWMLHSFVSFGFSPLRRTTCSWSATTTRRCSELAQIAVCERAARRRMRSEDGGE